jgi:hypothetical protein
MHQNQNFKTISFGFDLVLAGVSRSPKYWGGVKNFEYFLKNLENFLKDFENFLKNCENFLKNFENFLKNFENSLKDFENFQKDLKNFEKIGGLNDFFKKFHQFS